MRRFRRSATSDNPQLDLRSILTTTLDFERRADINKQAMSLEMEDSSQACSKVAPLADAGFDAPQAEASTEGWEVESSEVTDVDMERVAGGDGFRQQDWEEQVVIIGQDGYQRSCSSADLWAQSTKLKDLVTTEQGQARIHLPLPWQDITLLVDGLRPHRLATYYWDAKSLEELIRAIELYLFYDYREWDVSGLEEAMLKSLVPGHDEPDYTSRFDYADFRFASKVRCAAEQANMIRLMQLLDSKGLACVSVYEAEDERPRKWQKVSAK